jgi:holo-[acyl-carrier protein] synthase
VVTGVGIDLVDVKRMDRIIRKWGPRFIGKVFTAGEAGYCMSKADPAKHFAARFAVKEAFIKAFDNDSGIEFSFQNVEVEICGDSGKPLLKLNGELEEYASSHNLKFHLSITHTEGFAAAVIVAENNG